MLNLRAGAGVDNEIVATLPHDAVAISHSGQVEFVGEEEWWEIISAQGDTGWVNRRFLVVRPTLDSDSAMADRLLAEAATAMEFIAAVNDPVPLLDDLPAFSASVEIGGIGVFADAPSPFTAATAPFDNTRTYDFDPLPRRGERVRVGL